MQRYVSLLRGINVGGRTIKMGDLKACYEDAGFTQVSTLLQSGNVTFASDCADSQEIQAQLELAVGKRFEFKVHIWVTRWDVLRHILTDYPFESSNENFQHYVVFTRPEITGPLSELSGANNKDLETIQEGKEVVYWSVLKGMTLATPFAKRLTTSQFKEYHTVRNLKTLRKLID
jgi:uncharacterized protein (DUF1697 family)